MQGEWRLSPSGWVDFHPAPSMEPGITLSYQGEIIPEAPSVDPEPTQEPYQQPQERCPLCGEMLIPGMPHTEELG